MSLSSEQRADCIENMGPNIHIQRTLSYATAYLNQNQPGKSSFHQLIQADQAKSFQVSHHHVQSWQK
jgi:hypothetical protein